MDNRNNQKPQHRNYPNNNNKKNMNNGKNIQYAKQRAQTVQPKLPLIFTEGMTVSDIAEVTKRSIAEIIKTLMMMGVMANQTQTIDKDTAELLAGELKIEFKVDETKESSFNNSLYCFFSSKAFIAIGCTVS